MADRSRSASPARGEPRAKKQKTGGFKWKEKKPKDGDATESKDIGRLERGYRNRSPRRESYRDREEVEARQRSRRDADVLDETRGGDEDESRTVNQAEERKPPPEKNNNGGLDVASKFGSMASKPRPSTTSTTNTSDTTAAIQPSKEKKKKKPKSTIPSEPMIIVNINDRLGTKAAIPCLASDSIKAFKALVAAHIGRQPHEIMLKRQGERPFKDQLTLADYGVSSGVQLDLELDTGD